MKATAGLQLLNKVKFGAEKDIDLDNVLVIPCWNSLGEGESIFKLRALEELTRSRLDLALCEQQWSNVDESKRGLFLEPYVDLVKGCHGIRKVVVPLLKSINKDKTTQMATQMLLKLAEAAQCPVVLDGSPKTREEVMCSFLHSCFVDLEEAHVMVVERINRLNKVEGSTAQKEEALVYVEAAVHLCQTCYEDDVDGCQEIAMSLLNVVKTELENDGSFHYSFEMLKKAKSLFVKPASKLLGQAYVKEFSHLTTSIVEGRSCNMQNSERVLGLVLRIYHEGQLFKFASSAEQEWELMSRCLLERTVDDRNKVLVLNIMRQTVEMDSMSQAEHNFGRLWFVLNSSDWIVEEGFLQLLTSVAVKRKSKCKEFDETARNAALRYLSSANSYLRASAFQVLCAMATAWDPEELTLPPSILKEALLTETEAIVRRHAAKLARTYFRVHRDSIDEDTRDYLVRALLDLDRETKTEIFDHWIEVLEAKTKEFDARMDIKGIKECFQTERIGDAFVVSMKDFDRHFLAHVEKRLKSFETVLSAVRDMSEEPPSKSRRLSRPNGAGDDISSFSCTSGNEKVIDDIAFSDDTVLLKETRSAAKNGCNSSQQEVKFTWEDFVAALNEWDAAVKAKSFEKRVEDYCELQMGLESVLTDIIQSVAPESKIDGADCV